MRVLLLPVVRLVHSSLYKTAFSSKNSLQAPDFPNTDFVKTFAESFTAFVPSQDPNDTFEPTITPQWDAYAFSGNRKEMLFNRTEDGEPVVQEFITSASLLERCA